MKRHEMIWAALNAPDWRGGLFIITLVAKNFAESLQKRWQERNEGAECSNCFIFKPYNKLIPHNKQFICISCDAMRETCEYMEKRASRALRAN